MRLKSYFAATVEEAISLASRELGDEAMLIYSRETLPEARYLGQYEVVFALEAEAPAPASGQTPAARAETAPEPALPVPAESGVRVGEPALRAMRSEMADLRAMLGRMERLFMRSAGTVAATGWSPRGVDLHRELLEQELPEDLVIELVNAVESVAGPGRWWRRENAAAELARLLAPLCEGRTGMEQCRVHAVVGPSGGGKTTMLVKLAVLLGLERREPVMLVSLDSQRIGGAEQLRTFAQILGVPFAAADHRHGLLRLLENEGKRQLLLLDTPGFHEPELAEWDWLPDLLAGQRDARVHLVMPAYLRTRECTRLIHRFARFQPSSLMLTHMEESEATGGLLGELLRRGLPLSYCGTGPAIPEDIEPAGAEWLAQRLLPAAGAETRDIAAGASWATA